MRRLFSAWRNEECLFHFFIDTSSGHRIIPFTEINASSLPVYKPSHIYLQKLEMGDCLQYSTRIYKGVNQKGTH